MYMVHLLCTCTVQREVSILVHNNEPGKGVQQQKLIHYQLGNAFG